MEQELARKIAASLKVDTALVVREFWEIALLQGLFDSEAGRHLVFKGGTALRLAYGSPRFSEDLDFSLAKDTLSGGFRPLVEGIVAPLDDASITDLAEKRFTYLAEVKIAPSYLTMPFRIKVEISRRPLGRYGRELRLITSPQVSPLQVICTVASLDQIHNDKIVCLRDRTASRDLFDLWFISQILKRPWTPPKTGFRKHDIRRDLRKYLPPRYWDVIEGLA